MKLLAPMQLAPDTSLFRSAADILRTDDLLHVAGTAQFVLRALAGSNAPNVPTNAILTLGIAGTNTALNSTSGVFGLNVTATNAGTGDVTGVYGRARGPAIATLDGVTGQAIQQGGSSTTTARSLRAAAPGISGGGTIATAVGVDIEAQAVTGVTTGYGVRQLGANDLNVFAGSLKVGTSGTSTLGFYGATPVVRPTGWAAATGTATRATYATTTATVTQLAERLKALIDDLTTIGLIGP